MNGSFKTSGLALPTLLKWHRYLAFISCIFLLGSAISGISRTIDKALPSPQLTTAPHVALPLNTPLISAAQAAKALPDGTRVAAAECRVITGEPYWQFIVKAARPIPAPSGQFGPPLFVEPLPIYVHAYTGQLANKEASEKIDRLYAQELAQLIIPNATIDDQLLSFSMDYAVIERMRPVYRCLNPENPAEGIFVSTHLGAHSKYLNGRKRIDKMLFSLLHKFFFIKDREIREGSLVFVNLLMMLAAASGAWCWWRIRGIQKS